MIWMWQMFRVVLAIAWDCMLSTILSVFPRKCHRMTVSTYFTLLSPTAARDASLSLWSGLMGSYSSTLLRKSWLYSVF